MKNLLLILGFLLLGVAPSLAPDLDTIIRRGKLIVAVKIISLPSLSLILRESARIGNRHR
jgi:polar amino acid transport system substrate-binding protein